MTGTIQPSATRVRGGNQGKLLIIFLAIIAKISVFNCRLQKKLSWDDVSVVPIIDRCFGQVKMLGVLTFHSPAAIMLIDY